MSTATIPLNLLTCQQCVWLLQSVGCINFEEAFLKNNVTGLDLEYVETVEDLRELGTSLPMIKLRRIFEDLKTWTSKGVPRSVLIEHQQSHPPPPAAAVTEENPPRSSSASHKGVGPSTKSSNPTTVAPSKVEQEEADNKKRVREKKSSAKQSFADSHSDSDIDNDIIDVESDHSTSAPPKKKAARTSTKVAHRTKPVNKTEDEDLIARFMTHRDNGPGPRISVRKTAPATSAQKPSSNAKSSSSSSTIKASKSQPKSNCNPRNVEDVHAFVSNLHSWGAEKIVSFFFQVFLIQAKNVEYNKELFEAKVLDSIVDVLKEQALSSQSTAFLRQYLFALLRCICAIMYLGKDDVRQVFDKAVRRFDKVNGFDLMLLILRHFSVVPDEADPESLSARQEVIKWACRNLQLVEVCRPDTKSIRQGRDFPSLVALALEAGKECAATLSNSQMPVVKQKLRLDVFTDCIKAMTYLFFCLQSKDLKGEALQGIYSLHEMIFSSFSAHALVMRYFSLAISRFAVGSQYVKQIVIKLDVVTKLLTSLEQFLKDDGVATASMICQALFELSFNPACMQAIIQFQSSSNDTYAGSHPSFVQYLMFLMKKNLKNEGLITNLCALITNTSCDEAGIACIVSALTAHGGGRVNPMDEFAESLVTISEMYLQHDCIFQYVTNSLINLAFNKDLALALGRHRCCEMLTSALSHHASEGHNAGAEKTLLFTLRAIVNLSQYSANQVRFIGSTTMSSSLGDGTPQPPGHKLCRLLHQLLQSHIRSKELSERIVKCMANLARYQKDIQQFFGQLGTLELLLEMMENFFNNHRIMVEVCGLFAILTALDSNVVLLRTSTNCLKLLMNTFKAYMIHEDILLPLAATWLHVAEDDVCVKVIVKQHPALCKLLVDATEEYKGHFLLRNLPEDATLDEEKDPPRETGDDSQAKSPRFSTSEEASEEGGIDLAVYEIIALLVRHQECAKRISKLGLTPLLIADLLHPDYRRIGIFVEEVVDILSYLLQADDANQILMAEKQSKAWQAVLSLLPIHVGNKIVLHGICQCFENLSVTLPASLFLSSSAISDVISCLLKHYSDKELFMNLNDLLQTFFIAVGQDEQGKTALLKEQDVQALLQLLDRLHTKIEYVEPLCQTLLLVLKQHAPQSIALFLEHNCVEILVQTLRWYLDKQLADFPSSALLLCAQLCRDSQALTHFQQASLSEDLALMLQYGDICRRLRITEHIVDCIKMLENQQLKNQQLVRCVPTNDSVSEVEFIL